MTPIINITARIEKPSEMFEIINKHFELSVAQPKLDICDKTLLRTDIAATDLPQFIAREFPETNDILRKLQERSATSKRTDESKIIKPDSHKNAVSLQFRSWIELRARESELENLRQDLMHVQGVLGETYQNQKMILEQLEKKELEKLQRDMPHVHGTLADISQSQKTLSQNQKTFSQNQKTLLEQLSKKIEEDRKDALLVSDRLQFLERESLSRSELLSAAVNGFRSYRKHTQTSFTTRLKNLWRPTFNYFSFGGPKFLYSIELPDLDEITASGFPVSGWCVGKKFGNVKQVRFRTASTESVFPCYTPLTKTSMYFQNITLSPAARFEGELRLPPGAQEVVIEVCDKRSKWRLLESFHLTVGTETAAAEYKIRQNS